MSGFLKCEYGPLVLFKDKSLLETGLVNHGFSTRLGGVSEDRFESLNLGPNLGDDRQKVLCNFDIFTKAVGTRKEKLVLPCQVHEANVVAVTKSDCGNGILRKNRFDSADGLITNEKGVALTVFFADCVPILILDPEKEAIGVVHSGWRGTEKQILKHAIKRMGEEYGCRPHDMILAIGPSIGGCCYEVSEDVYGAVMASADGEKALADNGKYFLDLPEVCRRLALETGVLVQNITLSGLCTMCDPKLFFSHRYSNGKRGSLAAVLELKE